MPEVSSRHQLTVVSALLVGTAACLMLGAWFGGATIPALRWAFISGAAVALLFATVQVGFRIPASSRGDAALGPALGVVLAGVVACAALYFAIPSRHAGRAGGELVGTWQSTTPANVVLNLASFGFATYKTDDYSLRGPWHKQGNTLSIDVMTGTGKVPTNVRGRLEWAITKCSSTALELQGKNEKLTFQRQGA
jgi:hypothetical protein